MTLVQFVLLLIGAFLLGFGIASNYWAKRFEESLKDYKSLAEDSK